MTGKEFAVFVAAIKNFFPKEDTLLATTEAVSLWYEMLNDIPYDVATAALKRYISTNKWSPTIADIREQAALVQNGETADWGEGWDEVMTAISRYGMYRQAEALDSMSDMTRECVKRLGFQNLCLSENQMQDRANFRMIWEQLAQRRKTDSQIAPALAEKIAALKHKPVEFLGDMGAAREIEDKSNG